MPRWRSTKNGGGRSTTRKNGGRADERGRATTKPSVVLVPPGHAPGEGKATSHPREAESVDRPDNEGLVRSEPAAADRAALGRRPAVRAPLGSRSRSCREEPRVTP